METIKLSFQVSLIYNGNHKTVKDKDEYETHVMGMNILINMKHNNVHVVCVNS